MANIPNTNDPHRPTRLGEDARSPSRMDSELQPDPELTEGRAGGGRIALYAVAALVLLGAVFYGLNGGSMNPSDATKTASQSPTTQDSSPKAPAPTNNVADSNSKPPVAPGVRDVTPNANTEQGVTTGAAPARPQGPQAAPTGTEVDRSKGGATR
jgi:hypothetical protein